MRAPGPVGAARASRAALAAAVALLLAVPACCQRAVSGPAWPKSAGSMAGDPEEDGGQSLEPQFGSAIGAIERSADRTVPVPEDDGDDEDEVPAQVDDDADEDPAGDDGSATPASPDGEIEVIEIAPDDIVIEPDSTR